MSWTDDRVSLLKKLWGEGHTAAEIAKQLGGVTRNAVIGKAHRMKLSNRVSPIQQNKKPANKNVERKVVEKPKVVVSKKTRPVIVESAIANESQSGKLYTLSELKPRMCRWPCGDPQEDGFGFCGEESMPGLPYCAEHSKVAYQAATRNRIFKEEQEVAKVAKQLGKQGAKKAAG